FNPKTAPTTQKKGNSVGFATCAGSDLNKRSRVFPNAAKDLVYNSVFVVLRIRLPTVTQKSLWIRIARTLKCLLPVQLAVKVVHRKICLKIQSTGNLGTRTRRGVV